MRLTVAQSIQKVFSLGWEVGTFYQKHSPIDLEFVQSELSSTFQERDSLLKCASLIDLKLNQLTKQEVNQTVKVWEFDNSSSVYPKLRSNKILCLQLEQSNVGAVDFLILENPSEFTGEEFKDSELDPIPWKFAIPDELIECLEQVGALYLSPDFSSVPECS